MSAINLKPIIEALLFSTNEPLTVPKISGLIKGAETKQVRESLFELQKEYDEQGRGFALKEVAGGFQILSREEYSEYVKALHKTYAQARLSQAALETLAVIAYKQPVMRAEIEAIRGVGAGPLLRTLMDRGLVKIVGRADTLGRPALYGTTRKFLERFNLKSLKDLPKPEIEEVEGKPTLAQAEPVETMEVPHEASIPAAEESPAAPTGPELTDSTESDASEEVPVESEFDGHEAKQEPPENVAELEEEAAVETKETVAVELKDEAPPSEAQQVTDATGVSEEEDAKVVKAGDA